MKTKKVVINVTDANNTTAWYTKYHGSVIEVNWPAFATHSGFYYKVTSEDDKYIPVEHTFNLPSGKLIDGTSSKFVEVATNLAQLLEHKNQKYGDSALNPIKVFSKLDSSNSLYVRLDDKISRIKNSDVLRKNDIADLMGYLILVCVDNNWTDFSEFKD